MAHTGNRLLLWLVKPVLSLLCLSCILAFSRAIIRLPVRLETASIFWAAAGLATGLILFAMVSPMMPLYVLGHEFTHWLLAKLFRRRTGRFRVGADAGSVEVADPNIWIVLGPYLVPIYAIAWIGLWALLKVWFHPPWWPAALYAGMGFAYGFHCVLTVRVLHAGQSDLQHHGRIFSMLLIIAVNLGLLYLAVAILSGSLRAAPGCLFDAFVAQFNFLRRLL